MKLYKNSTIIFLFAIWLMSCEEEIPLEDINVDFNIENLESNQMTINPQFEGIENMRFSILVDDVVVHTVAPGEAGEEYEIGPLPEGDHTICIRLEPENDEADVLHCESVTIEAGGEGNSGDQGAEGCPSPAFKKEDTEDPGVFIFVADFEGMDEVEYKWVIDDEEVEIEALNEERDNQLFWQFSAGQHSVCLEVIQDDCGQSQACQVFEVGSEDMSCMPSFRLEDAGVESGVYTFTGSFERKETTPYEWLINGEVVDRENFDGTETDHELVWQFAEGEYEVCVVNASLDCNQEEFCMYLNINNGSSGDCPEPSYVMNKLSDRNYEFVADFAEASTLEYMVWTANALIIDNEILGTQTKDDLLNYTFPRPGTYNVCLTATNAACGRVSFCETIEVDFFTACVDMSFSSEKDPNADSYLFTADFSERDQVDYEWTVLGDENAVIHSETRISGSADDHSFEYQFEDDNHYVVLLEQINLSNESCDNYRAHQVINTRR